MGLELDWVNDDKYWYAPKIACGHCDEWIENVRYAHALFMPYDKHPSFVHQECSRAFDRDRGRTSMWEPLPAFLYRVLYNIKYDSIKAEELAELAHLRTRESIRAARKSARESVGIKLRNAILERDRYTCQHCGAIQADGAKLQIDHIIPVIRGGVTDSENLQTLCRSCNQRKRDR